MTRLGLPGNTAAASARSTTARWGVFAAYASRHGYAFLDKRLYVPQKWFEDEYLSRRKKCKMPLDLAFKTKPQLAAEMYRELRAEGIIPFKYVVADSIYGANPDFIGAIEEEIGTIYFVSMKSDTLCWLQRPSIEQTTVRGREALKSNEWFLKARKSLWTLRHWPAG